MSIKIEMLTRSEAALEDHDYYDEVLVNINDEKVFSVHDGEPEDNNLSRNFSSCYGILDLMENCYKLGLENKTVEFNTGDIEE